MPSSEIFGMTPPPTVSLSFLFGPTKGLGFFIIGIPLNAAVVTEGTIKSPFFVRRGAFLIFFDNLDFRDFFPERVFVVLTSLLFTFFDFPTDSLEIFVLDFIFEFGISKLKMALEPICSVLSLELLGLKIKKAALATNITAILNIVSINHFFLLLLSPSSSTWKLSSGKSISWRFNLSKSSSKSI